MPPFTRWRVQPVHVPRCRRARARPVTLTTLVSEHYGGERPESADHVERFYFTRELGSTRWERWQNLDAQPRLQRRPAGEGGRGAGALRPLQPEPRRPPEGAGFVMIDCREWTRIEPPADPGGDPPGFFIEAVRSRHLGRGSFRGSADTDPGAGAQYPGGGGTGAPG